LPTDCPICLSRTVTLRRRYWQKADKIIQTNGINIGLRRKHCC
jgi:hypothetical protein